MGIFDGRGKGTFDNYGEGKPGDGPFGEGARGEKVSTDQGRPFAVCKLIGVYDDLGVKAVSSNETEDVTGEWGEPDWVCGRCTAVNAPEEVRCRMCAISKYAQGVGHGPAE